MKTLRKTRQEGLARQADGIEQPRRVHEYPAVAFPTWVVDAGASYDVVPTGIAALKSWERISLKEPLGINTANGRIVSTHAVASQVPGMPEKIYAAEMPDTPLLISVGRRCLNHGYSFVWLAGRTPYFITPKDSRFHVRYGVEFHTFDQTVMTSTWKPSMSTPALTLS